MVELSNKTLAVLLLAAMVVSLGGTMLVLNKVSNSGITGYATTGTGTVQLTVGQSISIDMVDDTINFGSCTPLAGVAMNITSEDTGSTTTQCGSFTANYLQVRNDGNVNASVSMNVSKVGKLHNSTAPTAQIFLNSSTGQSGIWYKSTSKGDSGFSGGCTLGTVGTYTAITNPIAGSYVVCTNLRAHATINAVGIDYQIQVPYDATQTAETFNVQFTASISSTP